MLVYTHMTSYTKPTLPPIREKGSFRASKLRADIKALLIEQLDQIPREDKTKPHVIKHIGCILENIVKTKQFDKMEIMIDVLKTKFAEFNEEDKRKVIEMVEFMLENGDIRKKPIKFFLRWFLNGFMYVVGV